MTCRSATAIPSRFLSILDFDDDTLTACLDRAAPIQGRARRRDVPHDRPLEGCTSRCCSRSHRCGRARPFRSPFVSSAATSSSRRTDVALGGRESIADVARNLERWVFAAVVRTYAQDRLAEFAAAAPRLRVVNALTNEEHPCQALADCLTLVEKPGGRCEAAPIAFVGDGNNVATSLAQAAVHARRARADRIAAAVSSCRATSSTGDRAHRCIGRQRSSW